MAEALRLIREETGKGRAANVSVDGGKVHVGKKSFDLSEQTPYRSSQGQKAPYDAGSVALFASWFGDKGVEASQWGKYVVEARRQGVQPVAFPDAKGLAAFLQGSAESGMEFLDAEALTKGTEHSGDAHADGEIEAPEEGTMATQIKGRSEVLKVPKRAFNKALELVQAEPTRKAQRQAQGEEKRKHQNEQRGQKQQAGRMSVPSNRFNRVEEKEFYRDKLGESAGDLEQLGINPNATFLARDTEPPSSQPAEQAQPSQPPAKRQRHSHHRHHESSKQEGKQPVPIIVVPQGLGGNTLVNMYNAKKFIEEGVYEPWDRMRERGERKETRQTIWRQFGRQKPVQYELTDRVPKREAKADWGRVVAVIVNGAKWQFQGWPFPGAESGDLVETFSRVRGFFVCYEDDPLPDPVSKWNVKVLRLKRNSRHNDRAVAKDFWEEIDKLLNQRRSKLPH